MTSLVLRKVIEAGAVKLKLAQTGPRVISEGVLKLERGQVICPACGQQVEAVAWDGQVKGYCAVARQYVDFLIETQRVLTDKDSTAEIRATHSAFLKKCWQDPEYRTKIVATHTGKHFSVETRAKMSAALKRQHSAERGANERPN